MTVADEVPGTFQISKSLAGLQRETTTVKVFVKRFSYSAFFSAQGICAQKLKSGPFKRESLFSCNMYYYIKHQKGYAFQLC
jgi:hypothetical protein